MSSYRSSGDSRRSVRLFAVTGFSHTKTLWHQAARMPRRGRRGVTMVVAARRQQALDELMRECEAAGGHALPMPTDVTDEQAVQALAQRAIKTLSHRDWSSAWRRRSLSGSISRIVPQSQGWASRWLDGGALESFYRRAERGSGSAIFVWHQLTELVSRSAERP